MSCLGRLWRNIYIVGFGLGLFRFHGVAIALVQKQPDKVTANPNQLAVQYHFSRNSHVVPPADAERFSQAAEWLLVHPEARLIIIGFCDGNGSEVCADKLAWNRAVTVRELLLNRFHIPSDQIAGIQAWPEGFDTCKLEDLACQKRNRVVRLFLSPGE